MESNTTRILHKNKYTIVLSTLFDKTIHGFTVQSDSHICGHYLVLDSYYYNNNENTEGEDDDDEFYNNINLKKLFNNIKESCNYYNIEMRQINNIKPEIAECIILKGGETVAILKTFWIRLIQRTWKNIYTQKKQIINIAKTVNILKEF